MRIIDPVAGEIWLNADAVTVLFGAAGTPAPDFEGFIVSTDAGGFWASASNTGFHVLGPRAPG